ncbi:MAG: FtsQ-type POTRA domain-containing protein [Oscillospiraceae bacterium]|jgi:cell division protein FtsQ|nr:FtsQ-type POTRA domain-containing protein [Oscillospiraceae bacterium]
MQTGMQVEKKARGITKPGWIAAITLLSLALIGSWVASSTLFVVGSILVEGNDTLSSQEIIRLSGLKFGQSMLSLDSDKVKANVESNPYIRMLGLSREYPSRVVIKVETRYPAAIIPRVGGDSLIVDFDGNVMSLASQTGAPPELTYVSNADIPDSLARVGSNLSGDNAPESTRAAFAILNVLKSQDALGTISELNVKELDNLFLVTLSGIKVMLGRMDDRLPEKIAIMRAVLPELAKEGVRDGLLDVTAGNKADYRRMSSR